MISRLILKTLILLLVLTLIFSCGNRKPLTGGPADREKPEIISVSPENYQEIEAEIRITFSKPMDRASVSENQSSVYIYPRNLIDKISWEQTTMVANIDRSKLKDSNIYLSVSENIRDIRRNFLKENYLFVFRGSDQLYRSNIYGDIIYEKEEDETETVNISILDSDSLLIFTTQVQGKSYRISELNPFDQTIFAYIDRNNNNRFDLYQEPSFAKKFNPELTNRIDINLVYADTTKPRINRIVNPFNNQITTIWNKPVKRLTAAFLTPHDSLANPVEVLAYDIIDNNIFFLTTVMDSTTYDLTLYNVHDFKENKVSSLDTEIRASVNPDTLAPKVLSFKPADGSVVGNLMPDIEVNFSKIMLDVNLDYELVSISDQKEHEVFAIKKDSHNYVFRPRFNLRNMISYRFILKASSEDTSKNRLEDTLEIDFIIITN